jgi:hypothetical protein
MKEGTLYLQMMMNSLSIWEEHQMGHRDVQFLSYCVFAFMEGL